jgi:hypothetical protein
MEQIPCVSNSYSVQQRQISPIPTPSSFRIESEDARISMMMTDDVPQTEAGGEKRGEAKIQITKEEAAQIATTNSDYGGNAAVVGGW